VIIYKATNKKNEKSYIGQTKFDLNFRKKSHFVEAKNDNLPFHNALLKYKDLFIWEMLEECKTKDELDEMEFHYIIQYNTLFPNGYNLTLGGEGNHGWIPTNKQKLKISLAVKKWWDTKDEIFRKEWGKKIRKQLLGKSSKLKGRKQPKISIALKDRNLSETHKQNIGKGVRNRKYRHTDNFREQMRKRQLGKNNSFYGRKHNPEIIKTRMSHFGKDNPFYGKTLTKEQYEKKSRTIFYILDKNGVIYKTKVFIMWCKENKVKSSSLYYYSSKGKFFQGYKVILKEKINKNKII